MNDDINEGQIITNGLQHRPYRYKACTLDGSIICEWWILNNKNS